MNEFAGNEGGPRDNKAFSRRDALRMALGAAVGGAVGGVAAERAGMVPKELPNVSETVGHLKDSAVGAFKQLGRSFEHIPEDKTGKLIDGLVDKAETNGFIEIASGLRESRAQYVDAIDRPSGASRMREFYLRDIEQDIRRMGEIAEMTVPENDRKAAVGRVLEYTLHNSLETPLNEYEAVKQIAGLLPDATKRSSGDEYENPKWYENFDWKSLDRTRFQRIAVRSSFFSGDLASREITNLTKTKLDRVDTYTKMHMREDIEKICGRLAFETFLGEIKENLGLLREKPSTEQLQKIEKGFNEVYSAWAHDHDLYQRFGATQHAYAYPQALESIQKGLYKAQENIPAGLSLSAQGYIQVLGTILADTKGDIAKHKERIK